MSDVLVVMQTGVALKEYRYDWSNIAGGRSSEVLHPDGDVRFTKKDGSVVFHPRENIILVEVGP